MCFFLTIQTSMHESRQRNQPVHFAQESTGRGAVQMEARPDLEDHHRILSAVVERAKGESPLKTSHCLCEIWGAAS